MANQVSNVGFNDYSGEQADIERRRQLAQGLSQQSMQPLETQTAGGWAIPISPFQGLGKMLQSYAGVKGQQKATEQENALGQKYQSDYRAMMAKGLRELQGAPAQTIQPDPQEAQQSADQGTPQVGAVNQPAVAPDPMAALGTFQSHPMGAALAPLAMQQIQQQQGAQAIAAALRGDQGAAPQAQSAPPTGAPMAAGPQLAAQPQPGMPPQGQTGMQTPAAPPPVQNAQRYTPQQIEALVMSNNPQAQAFGKFLAEQEQKRAALAQADAHFSGVSGNTKATQEQAERHWSNLSPYQQAELKNKNAQLGIAGGHLAETQRHNAAIEGDPTTIENTAQAIASGNLAPLSGFALAKPMGQQIMARVMALNPQYSAKDFGTGQKAEKDFATGKPGQAVRSFNVALSHLDTLDQLSDALHNNNLQVVNKIGNAYAQQTGSPAPTNFESAKKIVADEIVKAIVGSGGGVSDREAAAKTISAVSSPAQLKGVINTYKELMRGQLGGLKQQYETSTGRKDFDRLLTPSARAQEASPTVSAGAWKITPAQ